jgi:tetratricopeptide (TPR) repeat protein
VTVAFQRRLTFILLLCVVGVAVWSLGWYACRSRHSRFLTPGGRAEWIVYPVPPQSAPTLDSPEQRTLFRRSFDLAGPPATARLCVRAFSTCSVAINGRSIQLCPAEQWNQGRTAEVGPELQAGVNEIQATVINFNDVGPPVLWLSLDGPGWSVVSDEQWAASLDGAAECPAYLAREPIPIRPGNPVFGGFRTLDSVRRCLPELAIFGLVSAAALFGFRRAFQRTVSLQLAGYRPEPIHVGLFLAILLWVLLLGHNSLSVPLFYQGFDVPSHLNYIKYIQQHGTLPLADEGWEMHQPPLYYLLAVGLLRVFRCQAADWGALPLLRLLAMAIGIGQLVAVAGCLRLVFPGQPRRQLLGLGLAAFLPVHIYLSHYVTNETLLMLLATAAIYLCLRILRTPSPSLMQFGLLGLCLGAGLLTKVTALVTAGTVLLVLAGKGLLVRKFREADHWPADSDPSRATASTWWRGTALTALITILVSGWHYVRVWRHFGKPLVGNFDSITGFHFWQDPGYGTLAYLVHFGRVLTDPFFSALHGLPDGLYSTFWGDGLCGGVSTWAYRPPWNHELMAAGYLLALVPTLLIGVGLVLAIVGLLRTPSPQWFLLLGLAGGLAVGLLYQFIRFPYYGHAKAFYELTGMVTVCALGALGMDFVVRRSRALGLALGLLCGIWACTAYLSYWIRPDSATARTWVGLQQQMYKRFADVETSFQEAERADPHSIPARLAHGDFLAIQQQHPRARRLYEEILREDPANPEALFRLGVELEAQGNLSEALSVWQRTAQLAPDHPLLYGLIGNALARQDRIEAAISAFRQALRVAPVNPGNHASLGLLLARTGNIEEALPQYRFAVTSRSADPAWFADLAWLLATQEESRFREPAEALRLANQGCARAGSADAACLQALAAAQAAGGRYPEAAQTARRALERAASSRQLQQLRLQIEHYNKDQPFYTRAPLRVAPYGMMFSRMVLE